MSRNRALVSAMLILAMAAVAALVPDTLAGLVLLVLLAAAGIIINLLPLVRQLRKQR